MSFDQFFLFVVMAIAIYFLTRQGVRRAVRSGVPTQVYLRYVYPRRVAVAYDHGNAPLAERQIYHAYLAQLTAPKDADRELALKYLEQLPISQELVDHLIEALPQQSKRALQLRMVQLLRTAMIELEHGSYAAKDNFESGLPEWSRAISVWLAVIILVALRWSWLTQLAGVYFIVITVVLLGIALLAVTWVTTDRKMFVRVAGLMSGLVLAGLWFFSNNSHAGLDSTPQKSLENYGLGATQLQITYPRWLTIDNVGSCTAEVTITVFGTPNPPVNPIEISFLYNHADLFVSDNNCQALSPSFNLNTANTAGLPYQFYIMLPRRDVLAKRQIVVTPQVRDSANNGQPYPATNLEFTIQLEDPLWEGIRNIGQVLFGATTISSFLVALYAWYRQRA